MPAFPDPLGPFLSPVALLIAAGLAGLYLRGLGRPRLIRENVDGLRHLAFGAGLILWVVAMNWPLAPAAQRLFALHQLGHLLLRLLGPLLFVLARPWPVLVAGLSRPARRALDGPALRGVLRLGARLPLAFALMVGWFYFWQLPAVHNAALASPGLILLAHLGMAVFGVNFLACLLDRRETPDAHLQAPRVLAAIGVILSNILLGSLTTLKEVVTYTAYDLRGRLWDMAPLADETIGGYTIWVPSSMIMIVVILLVISGWNAAELRRWENRHRWSGSNAAALEFPETAQELRLKVATPNRQMGQALAVTALAIFLVVMSTAIAVLSLL